MKSTRFILLNKLMLISSFFIGAQAFSQDSSIVKSKAGWLPSSTSWEWILKDSVCGDLNNDGLDDYALMYQFHDTIRQRIYDGGTEDLDELPLTRLRKLVILFRDSSGYRMVLSNEEFMLREDEGGAVDPYEGMTIEKNVLSIHFTGGSAWKWGVTYKFNYRQSRWKLIGATRISFHNVTGEFTSNDYNFLTGRKKLSTNPNIFEDSVKDKVEWKTIPKNTSEKYK